MRKPARAQNPLRNPLNSILGTEGAVRVLRVLTESGQPVTKVDLANRAGLQLPGTIKVLQRLQETGIVEAVSLGKRPLVELCTAHPLSTPLKSLFEAEASRLEEVKSAIKRTAEAVRPTPQAAWLSGDWAGETAPMSDSLLLTVVAKGRELEEIVEKFRERTDEIERRADIDVEVRGLTRADLEMVSLDEWDGFRHSTPLFGLPPDAYDPACKRSDEMPNTVVHSVRDDEAKLFALKLAEKLGADPSLKGVMLCAVEKRIEEASEGERLELSEWQRILTTKSTSRLIKFLLKETQEATRLRQTMPFLSVLTPTERTLLRRESAR